LNEVKKSIAQMTGFGISLLQANFRYWRWVQPIDALVERSIPLPQRFGFTRGADQHSTQREQQVRQPIEVGQAVLRAAFGLHQRYQVALRAVCCGARHMAQGGGAHST
jgi:hypothetical protein